jgi:3-hydroxyisobutyrate dehydrogenase-like beta-hydroxyacid dehydrogenase
MTSNIAVLGAGRMGSALVRALLRAGHTVHVFNRTYARSEPLRADGAQLATRVADAVSAAQVIFVCVHDYTSAHRLLQELDADLLRGRLLVQLGSGSPREARESAQWARANGLHYLDGAIMATPDFIGEAGCTILYAGDAALYTEHLPLLRALGGNPQHVGDDHGAAGALDSALLAFMWGDLFGILQGIAVCEAEGLSLETFAKNVTATRPVLDGAAANMVARVVRRHYAADETTLATLGAHYGAFKHLREICAQRGLEDALPAAFGKLFEAAVEAGHEPDDFTALHKYMGAATRS